MLPTILLQIELPSSNIPWLFAAFAVSWAVFFLYVLYVTRRQQEMQNQIRQLQRILEQQDAAEAD